MKSWLWSSAAAHWLRYSLFNHVNCNSRLMVVCQLHLFVHNPQCKSAYLIVNKAKCVWTHWNTGCCEVTVYTLLFYYNWIMLCHHKYWCVFYVNIYSWCHNVSDSCELLSLFTTKSSECAFSKRNKSIKMIFILLLTWFFSCFSQFQNFSLIFTSHTFCHQMIDFSNPMT